MDDEGRRYQIGEVAERTGVTQRTLRFYEERGLITPTARLEGGFRLYSENDIERVGLIKKLQELLGLSLAEIKEMVDAEQLRAQIRATFRPDRELPARRERVQLVIDATRRQLEIVEHKSQQLSEMHEELRERLGLLEKRAQEIEEATRAFPVQAE
ncbi:MAG: MerR family transcriptional regulator [Chloroflexi bacterium]|nr:MerR family transcriptional regulator [Chloroflexota bacterium]